MKQMKDSLKNRCTNLGKEISKSRNKPVLEYGSPDEPVRDFLAEKEKNEKDADEVKELAAQKILSMIMNKNSLYNEDELALELVRLVKSITTRDVIDRMLEYMVCPLLSNPKWDNCGNDLEKGNTEFCHGIEFMKCPAFARYEAHEIVEKPKRKKYAKKKEEVKK